MKILAPIDFSPATDLVLEVAVDLARALHGELVLLHVTEPTATVVDFAVAAISVAGLDEKQMKANAKRLSELAARLQTPSLAVRPLLLVGTPAEEILAQTKALPADYVVVGSHGHSALHDLVAGSTARSVLRHAPCPVAVVPTPSLLATGDSPARSA